MANDPFADLTRQAQNDQQEAAMRTVAGRAGSYYRALRAVLPEEVALDLLYSWHETYWRATMAAMVRGPHAGNDPD